MLDGSILAAVASPRRQEILRLVWHRERYRSPAAAAFVEAAVRLCAQYSLVEVELTRA